MSNPPLKKRFLLTQLIDVDLHKNVFKDRSISHNIFTKPKQSLNISQGPIFDKAGLVERSIVGKAETFLKIQEQQQHQNKAFNSINMNATTMKFVRRISSKKLSSQSKKSQDSQKSDQTARQEHQNTKREFQVINKGQVLKLLQAIKYRIDRGQDNLSPTLEQNDLLTQKLNVQNQTLQNFENQLKIWNQQVSKQIVPTNRNQQESIINTSQKFRRKIEEIQLNEILKESKGEKPINHWQHSLRQQEKHNKSISLDSQRISLLSEQGKNLEIIVHPNLMKNENEQKINSSTGGSRINFNKNKEMFQDLQNMPYLQMNHVNEEEFNELIIIGQNKFRLEKEFVQDQSDKTQFRLYQYPKEEIINEMIEE